MPFRTFILEEKFYCEGAKADYVRYYRDQNYRYKYLAERKCRSGKNAEALSAPLQYAFIGRIYAFFLCHAVNDDVCKETKQEREEHAEHAVKYPIFRADKYVMDVYDELQVKDHKWQAKSQHTCV